jgi:hypothetical protein
MVWEARTTKEVLNVIPKIQCRRGRPGSRRRLGNVSNRRENRDTKKFKRDLGL